MPKLTTIDANNTCYLCGCQAHYISVNSKKMRCVEKITQCPGFVEKAEASRQRNMSADQRRAHMKNMSQRGNAILKERHTDQEWVTAKGNKISDAVKRRGGHSGENNPMFGKTHTEQTKKSISNANKGNKNPMFGKKWIHSLDYKCSKRINKNDPVPIGWLEGRKIKF